jgi:hypothetical protein
MADIIDTELEEFMLTTLDNPFNPFTQWDQWYAFDLSKGYNTCAYLARIVKSSHELSEYDEALAVHYAMNEIMDLNVLGIYRKVTKKSFINVSDVVSFPTVTVRLE